MDNWPATFTAMSPAAAWPELTFMIADRGLIVRSCAVTKMEPAAPVPAVAPDRAAPFCRLSVPPAVTERFPEEPAARVPTRAWAALRQARTATRQAQVATQVAEICRTVILF